MSEVWVIDDDRSIRWVLEKALAQEGMDVTGFASGTGVLQRLSAHRPDAIMSDIRMPDVNGLDLLKSISTDFPGLPVIIMTAYSDLDSAVAAYQGGAFEYLPKPFDVDDAVDLVRRAVGHGRARSVAAPQTAQSPDQEIIGSAPAMQEVFRAIGRLSRSNITVLITGESGTGKELVARALHRHSPPKVARRTLSQLARKRCPLTDQRLRAASERYSASSALRRSTTVPKMSNTSTSIPWSAIAAAPGSTSHRSIA